jgi:uncharacterized protein (TIGR00369 family)
MRLPETGASGVTETMDDESRLMLERAVGDGRQQFGSFFLSRLLGMEVAYDENGCTVSFEAKRQMFNPQGVLHGGIIGTALDISMGHLLQHHVAPGTTLEMKVQYFAPVRGGLVRCRAEFLKKGRKVFFLQSRASDAGGEPIAHATATWKLL